MPELENESQSFTADDLEAMKVGRRNSGKDAERLQGIHDYAVENGAQCLGYPMGKSDAETLVTFGAEVKALGDGRVGGYLVRFSSQSDPDISGARDYFTPETDFMTDFPAKSPAWFNHALDTKKKRLSHDADLRRDEFGVWAETILDERDRYEKFLLELAGAGKLGWSSGTASHLVEREPVGEAHHVKRWPLGLDASLTHIPAEPRNEVLPLKSISALLPPLPPEDLEPEGGNAPEETEAEGGEFTVKSNLEVTMDITEEKLQEMISQAAVKGAETALKSLPAEKSPEVAIVKDEADQKWSSAGEFFKAVKLAANGTEDVRLRALKAGASGASESIPSEGGYLVSPQFAPGIIERMYPVGSLLGMVASDPVSGNSMTYNSVDETSRVDGSRQGGILAYWAAEAGAYTGSQPKFKQLELKLKKVIGLCYATDELLEDAPALESWLMRTVPNELRFRVEDAFVNGNGVGRPLGFLVGPGKVEITAETSQLAATIVYENLIKMWAQRWIGANDYVWLINQDTIPQLLTLGHAVGTGALPPNFVNYSVDGIMRIMGRPVMEQEYMPTLGTAGDITLFSPSQYQTIRKNSIQTASSIHVKFDYGETAFRFTYRIDGCPIWDSAVTPFKGSNTIAPVVTIATRS